MKHPLDTIKKRRAFLTCALIIFVAHLIPAAGPARRALIIGNSDYAAGPLRNPVNDAKDLSNVLKSSGFTVSMHSNRTLVEMESDILSFVASIRPGDIALFFFAGHGLQVDGINYLLPIDNSAIGPIDLRRRSIEAGTVVRSIANAGSALNIIILDSCRDNPIASTVRSSARGLAVIETPRESETIIVFAARDGEVALDGEGRNSPFTSALLETIVTPDIEVISMFNRVGARVRDETAGRQIPAIYTEPLSGAFRFFDSETISMQAERAVNDVQRDIDDLGRAIATLQQQIDSATNERERRELRLEQERQQAVAAAQQLRLERLSHEAEIARLNAENARKEQQQVALIAESARRREAELSALAARRRNELERLSAVARQDDPDEIIGFIEQLRGAIREIEYEFAVAVNEALDQIDRTFADRFLALDASEPFLWETDREFLNRIGSDRRALEHERSEIVRETRYSLDVREQTQTYSLNDQLESARATLRETIWTVPYDSVDLQYVDYDRNRREWTFKLDSLDPAVPLKNWEIRLRHAQFDDAVQDARGFAVVLYDPYDDSPITEQVMRIDTALQADALLGQIEYRIRPMGSSEYYEVTIERVSVRDILHDHLYSRSVRRRIADFAPESRLKPVPWIPVSFSSGPHRADVSLHGSLIGTTPFTSFVRDQKVTVTYTFKHGETRSRSFRPGRNPHINVNPPRLALHRVPTYSFLHGLQFGFDQNLPTFHAIGLGNYVLSEDDRITEFTWMPMVQFFAGPALTRSSYAVMDRNINSAIRPVLGVSGFVGINPLEHHYEQNSDSVFWAGEESLVSITLGLQLSSGLSWYRLFANNRVLVIDFGALVERSTHFFLGIEEDYSLPSSAFGWSVGLMNQNIGVRFNFLHHPSLSSSRHQIMFSFVPNAN